MFIVYDQTWKRHLVYGQFFADTSRRGPRALWSAGDDEPLSVFRTRKLAEEAITNTQNYARLAERPKWTRNSYIILPLKLERKK